MTETDALDMLTAAGVFVDLDEDEPDETRRLNLNDVFSWASADDEAVPDCCLSELGGLFWRYGWSGLLYWVHLRRGGQWSEFADANRMIEFVTNEERIRTEFPDSTKRAYHRAGYWIGESLQ